MSIYVVEQGRRVATPLEALFPRRVQSVVRTARVDPVDAETSGGAMPQAGPRPEAAAAISAYREQSEPPAPRRQAKMAADVMTAQPFCLAPDALASSAWKLMQQHGVHHVLIAGADLVLEGIVSDRDIWHALSLAGEPLPAADAAARTEPGMPARSAVLEALPVEALMTRQVVCTGATTSIRRVAEVMLLHRIDALPVTDDMQHVQGIVTRTDLLRALVLEAPLELWI